jgi:hypothetical protein
MSEKLQTLKGILDTPRNGANSFIRHPLSRRMRYSDGVAEIADQLGAYWLLDIIATECAAPFIAAYDRNAVGVAEIHVKAKDSRAELAMTFKDGAPPVWQRSISYTDLPDHDWLLILGAVNDPGSVGTACNLILLTEY